MNASDTSTRSMAWTVTMNKASLASGMLREVQGTAQDIPFEWIKLFTKRLDKMLYKKELSVSLRSVGIYTGTPPTEDL